MEPWQAQNSEPAGVREGGRKMYDWNQASDWLHRIQLKPPFPGHRVQEIIPFFRLYDVFSRAIARMALGKQAVTPQNKAVTPQNKARQLWQVCAFPQSSQLSNHISPIELLVNRILKCSESYQWAILVFPNYKQKQVSLIAWEKPAIWVKKAKKTSH